MFSAFAPFGALAFSDTPPLAQRIYDSLRTAHGDNFAEGGFTDAKWYAQAMMLARAANTLQGAANNAHPMLATELLPELEEEWGITAKDSDGEYTRNLRLANKQKHRRGGSRQTYLEERLATLLGTGFISLILAPGPSVDPTAPESNALYQTQGVAKAVLRLKFGTPGVQLPPGDNTCVYDVLYGDAPIPGTKMVLGAEDQKSAEVVTLLPQVLHVTPNVRFVSVRAHDFPTLLSSVTFPRWTAKGRRYLIKVTEAVALDANKAASIHALMHGVVRGTATWGIVSDTDNGFILDQDYLDISTLLWPILPLNVRPPPFGW